MWRDARESLLNARENRYMCDDAKIGSAWYVFIYTRCEKEYLSRVWRVMRSCKVRSKETQKINLSENGVATRVQISRNLGISSETKWTDRERQHGEMTIRISSLRDEFPIPTSAIASNRRRRYLPTEMGFARWKWLCARFSMQLRARALDPSGEWEMCFRES